jgi:hypothetical protein
MSNERHRPPQASPRIVDRIQLARSTGRHLDGIWIGTWRGTPEDLAPIERALLLVKQHSPLNYARIIRDLERVWVYLLPHGLGEYKPSLKACLLDERYVADPATSIERIASTIVHEATHARLERYGIGYKEEYRARIEAICFRRELAFAARLPDSAELQQEIGLWLDWYQANPDYFHDAQFQERRTGGEIEVLRHLGTPDWLIRALLVLRPVIGRAKRLFRFEAR